MQNEVIKLSFYPPTRSSAFCGRSVFKNLSLWLALPISGHASDLKGFRFMFAAFLLRLLRNWEPTPQPPSWSHFSTVTKMLPGGVAVVGVYGFGPPALDLPSRLQPLARAACGTSRSTLSFLPSISSTNLFIATGHSRPPSFIRLQSTTAPPTASAAFQRAPALLCSTSAPQQRRGRARHFQSAAPR